MSTEKITASSTWQNAALSLLTAIDVVKKEGNGVIVKWDGKRENGKIYTVVWEGDEANGSRFRSDTDDLEWALRQVVSTYECSTPEQVSQVAACISTIDRAARASHIVSLRMTRSVGGANSRLVIGDTKNKNVLFDREAADLTEVLLEAHVLLDAMQGFTNLLTRSHPVAPTSPRTVSTNRGARPGDSQSTHGGQCHGDPAGTSGRARSLNHRCIA